MISIKAKINVIRQEFGGYITYIFENLESTSWTNKYILVTRYPNWEDSFPNIGDVGYITYSEIICGEEYFNTRTQKYEKYQSTHFRYDKFLIEQKIDNNYVMQIV